MSRFRDWTNRMGFLVKWPNFGSLF
ncbi:hypothetical protein TorRG33x02_168150 [Trema orientale]|uniref:Uncharacterized protein n=1 Tax=Trema orientale TaxID=63057 RepID=A0A2P5EP54_TREOI|nr:hypothetical protein TorRG33x02_168150 [Trema orientale]